MAREQLEQGEVEALVHELETKMARLRSIYEQYFMGIEKMPPRTLRKDVVRIIHRMENLYVRNTALKFKIRSLVQRFNSYKAYWMRVERQIEEGTYVRDIRRAERNREKRRNRSRKRGEDAQKVEGMGDDGVLELNMEEIVDLKELEVEFEAMSASGAFDRKPNEPIMPNEPRMPAAAASSEDRKRNKLAEIAGALGLDDSAVTGLGASRPTQAAEPAKPQRTIQAKASTAESRGTAVSLGSRRSKLAEMKRKIDKRTGGGASTNGGGGDDAAARRVYNQLLEAKRKCNEPTDKISYASVAKSMQKQRAQLQQSRGGDVDFKVVIKDGRAFIKPETK